MSLDGSDLLTRCYVPKQNLAGGLDFHILQKILRVGRLLILRAFLARGATH